MNFKAAIGDAILTFMWNICVSTLGLVTTIPGNHQFLKMALAITNFHLIHVADDIGRALGDANYNPATTLALYMASVGPDDLPCMALRILAQIAGAVGGFMALMNVMPAEFRDRIEGPVLWVDAHSGAIAECFLTFLMTLVVLVIDRIGPTSSLFKTSMFTISTLVVVHIGKSYTGASVNPAGALGWAYVNNNITCTGLYVYLLSPFFGAILAAWLFRAILAVWLFREILAAWLFMAMHALGWAYVNNNITWEQVYVYLVFKFVGAILAAWLFRFRAVYVPFVGAILAAWLLSAIFPPPA